MDHNDMYEHAIVQFHVPTGKRHYTVGRFLSRAHMIALLAHWTNDDYVYGPAKSNAAETMTVMDHTNEYTHLKD